MSIEWDPLPPSEEQKLLDQRVIQSGVKVQITSRNQDHYGSSSLPKYHWVGVIVTWSEHGITIANQRGPVFVPWSNISHIEPVVKK